MAKNIYVDAENEEQAMAKVREIINNNPYEYANNFSHYVCHKVIDAYEYDWEWLWLYLSLQVGGINYGNEY